MKRNKSNRTYPPKDCKNPACDIEPVFVPTWFTQVFCQPQCRWNYHNDQRRIKASTTHIAEKLLRGADKKLGEMLVKVKRGNLAVTDALLAYEGIDTSLSTFQEKNIQTGGQIRWFHCYGLELIPATGRYTIHQRNVK